MIKIFLASLLAFAFYKGKLPEVHVKGATSNIMIDGNLRAFADLDSFKKKNLYALGPVQGLKGEYMVLDGEVISSERRGDEIVNKRAKGLKAAMTVYSYVKEWKAFEIDADIKNYAGLESFVSSIAKQQGFDTTVPFAFKIEAKPQSFLYHVIDWQPGTKHTMQNHKQFAYSGKTENSDVVLLGFYSDHHHSIFTHHTTNMHVHSMDKKTNNVGHVDDLQLQGAITIYLPAEIQ